jgi:hypothetical protein
MRSFGDTLLQIYLFISLFIAALGLTEVFSIVMGWEQSWFTLFVGLFSFIWFLATFFIIKLFRVYCVNHQYYLLPIFYVLSYVILTILVLLVLYFNLSWSWISTFFISASFISSLIELVIAGVLLGRLSSFKKKLKLGKKKLEI